MEWVGKKVLSIFAKKTNNMKNILLIITIAFFAFNAKAQELTFSEVKTVDSTFTKDDLYLKTKMWFANTFKDAKEVIQLDDKENGIIIGKGSISIYHSQAVFAKQGDYTGYIRFTIKVQVKDGRYKYELYNFVHSGKTASFGLLTTDNNCPVKISMTTQGWRDKSWNEIKNKATYEAQSLINSLYVNLSKANINSKNNDNEEW